MSRSSSISSSETDRPGRYLLIAALLGLGTLSAVAAVSFVVKWRTELTEAGALVAFQRDRLAAAGPVDTIFVGDSSLGNAIDAAEFDRLAGTRSVNLALNGMFGYAGSYNMIRRGTEARPGVRNVVIVQTLDMMARPVSYGGYLLSAPDADLSGLEPKTRWTLAKAFASELADWKPLAILARQAVDPGRRPLKFAGDYIKQGRDRPRGPRRAVRVEAMQPENTVFLRAIAALCRERGLNCIYAHGPIAAAKLDISRPYLAAANRAIGESGLPVAGGPLPLPQDEIGDSEDHAAPGRKLAATAFYAEILAPRLALGARRDPP